MLLIGSDRKCNPNKVIDESDRHLGPTDPHETLQALFLI